MKRKGKIRKGFIPSILALTFVLSMALAVPASAAASAESPITSETSYKITAYNGDVPLTAEVSIGETVTFKLETGTEGAPGKISAVSGENKLIVEPEALGRNLFKLSVPVSDMLVMDDKKEKLTAEISFEIEGHDLSTFVQSFVFPVKHEALTYDIAADVSENQTVTAGDEITYVVTVKNELGYRQYFNEGFLASVTNAEPIYCPHYYLPEKNTDENTMQSEEQAPLTDIVLTESDYFTAPVVFTDDASGDSHNYFATLLKDDAMGAKKDDASTLTALDPGESRQFTFAAKVTGPEAVKFTITGHGVEFEESIVHKVAVESQLMNVAETMEEAALPNDTETSEEVALPDEDVPLALSDADDIEVLEDEVLTIEDDLVNLEDDLVALDDGLVSIDDGLIDISDDSGLVSIGDDDKTNPFNGDRTDIPITCMVLMFVLAATALAPDFLRAVIRF